MDVLYEACQISCERWIKEFEQGNTEIHKFSKQHQKAMHNICNKISGPYSRRTFIAIAVAIIILLLTTSVFALSKYKEYIIEKFSEYSAYSVSSADNSKKFEQLTIEYLPLGFYKSDESITSISHQVRYLNEDLYIQIQKCKIGTDLTFDTEDFDYKELEIDGMKYILYFSTDNTVGVIWNNNEYEYLVLSNMEQNEIIKTVLSIQ